MMRARVWAAWLDLLVWVVVWQECAAGIHFYVTREEAEAHAS